MKSSLIAIVNLTEEGLKKFSADHEIYGEDLEQNPEVKKAFMDEIEKVRVE